MLVPTAPGLGCERQIFFSGEQRCAHLPGGYQFPMFTWLHWFRPFIVPARGVYQP